MECKFGADAEFRVDCEHTPDKVYLHRIQMATLALLGVFVEGLLEAALHPYSHLLVTHLVDFFMGWLVQRRIRRLGRNDVALLLLLHGSCILLLLVLDSLLDLPQDGIFQFGPFWESCDLRPLV